MALLGAVAALILVATDVRRQPGARRRALLFCGALLVMVCGQLGALALREHHAQGGDLVAMATSVIGLGVMCSFLLKGLHRGRF
jgi:hypothetical protein